MGNVDSSPPHSHHHHGTPHSSIGAPYPAVNGNGSAYNVHQVVDTRGAPIGSDYVDIGSALESISKEDMERRFLEIVVSQNFYLTTVILLHARTQVTNWGLFVARFTVWPGDSYIAIVGTVDPRS